MPTGKTGQDKGRGVLILGDFAHFEHGVLRLAFDHAEIPYGSFAEITNDTAGVNLFWNPWSLLPPPSEVAHCINGGGFVCSKENVSRIFSEVFGYNLAVDPLNFQGPMTQKSDENAAHDGVTIIGPLAGPEDIAESKTYQRLVNNDLGPSVMDIRVSIVKTVQDHCYIKFRPIGDRYSNENSVSWLAPTSVFLSNDEQKLINEFCVAIRLDFGQLDVCRDRVSDKIYIVDANNTPYGPPNGMNEEDKLEALRLLAADFVNEFLQGSA